MLRFEHYNVIVHGNPKYRRGDFPFEPAEGPVARAYEERVRATLNYLRHTVIGRALLQSLNFRVPVYIVPWTGEACNSKTGQLTSDRDKGIRVQYSPEIWAYDVCGVDPGYRADESLFHEMVHASRLTRLGFERLKNYPMKDMNDPEEFLAVTVSNMYRAERGAQKFSRDYRTAVVLSQVQLEAYLASRRDCMKELDDFVSDYLVKLVTPLRMSFNPFRDLMRLKALPFQSATPGLVRFA